MSDTQVSNVMESNDEFLAAVAPESDSTDTSSGDFNVNEFFLELDKSVNTSDYQEVESDTSQVATSEESIDNNMDESPVREEANVENEIQQRYAASSKEAKRLNDQLKAVEPYMPILDAMREDPNLITHVRNYFDGGGQTPVSMKERLSLDEDFVFDADDAVSNPTSDSGKLLGATVDGIVQQRLNSALANQKEESNKRASESTFKSKHEMSDNEWEGFVDYAKNKTLELDDILYLKQRSEREKNIASEARKEVTDQMRRASTKPQSLATAGSAPSPSQNPDDSVFDAIAGSGAQLDNLFGN
tara:strand:- start:1014 stop:1919 length:906 start_codon:yes stop_codon:yes gene_type:complete